MQDRRRQIWVHAADRRWASFDELNAWLAQRCRQAWSELRHPQWRHFSVAEALDDERGQLMPVAKPFDGYVEQWLTVSPTALVTVQRNRYSVPTRYANRRISVRLYAAEVVMVADAAVIARWPRSIERDRTDYDWQHYIDLVQIKPGALRNGAPFATMPEPLQQLQRCLLKHEGGDRVMAQVLAAVPLHGVEAVVTAVERTLATTRPSGAHVLNVLARLKSPALAPPDAAVCEAAAQLPALRTAPLANVQRYDQLRDEVVRDAAVPAAATQEGDHVE